MILPTLTDIFNGRIESCHNSFLKFKNTSHPHVIAYQHNPYRKIFDSCSNGYKNNHR